LEEANNIAAATSLSSDKAYQNWLTLTDGDKEVLLRNSCRDINSLKFDGRRKNLSQILEFPRVDTSASGLGYRMYIGQLYDNGLYSSSTSDGGLSMVRQAQVINAIYAGFYNDLTLDTLALNIQGITSKKAGPISETYNRTQSGAFRASASGNALIGIYTNKVFSLLAPWLNDSRISY
jgi:hypothetical protein